jgi:uncharacterized protein (DUF1697 family)
VKYAAFFRNMNLGRQNCPSKAQLENAFVRAGAERAASFLTNGTVVFDVPSGGRARKILVAAHRNLQIECGLKEPAYVRTVKYLAELVALEPFASVERASVYEFCVTFLPPEEEVTPLALPMKSKRQDVELVRSTGTEVFSLSRKVGNTPGSPNAYLEKHLGSAVTTRAWNTVVRLVHRHA